MAHPPYMHYLLRSDHMVKEYQRLGKYLPPNQFDISWESFRAICVPLPPLDEQLQIAAFLEDQVARMDQAIALRERQLQIMHERVQTLVYFEIFGKSVSGNDTKVFPWPLQFLEVPNDWDVRAVRSLFRSGRGRVISHEDIVQNPGPYPVFSSQTENNGQMGAIASYDFDGEYLTWTTDGARAGTVFHRFGRFNCTNVCGTLKGSEELDYKFMCYALNAVTAFFVRHDINPKLMNDVMLGIPLPVPSLEAQTQIAARVAALETESESIAVLIRRQIALLGERKRSLITAAVAGKFDVSSASTRLLAGVTS